MTGTVAWARLSFRQQRWELILVALGVATVAIAMLWFASQLVGMRAASPDCLGGQPAPATCQAVIEAYGNTANLADSLLYLSFGAPFGIGVLLGAPLVAREIEGGTAQLAWSIGRSRAWWLLRRIAFVAVFAVLALAVLAATSETLAAALAPERDLSADFLWLGRRGWLIVARGVGVLMVGMLVGALIGRVLPGILAAILVVAVAFIGISLGMDRWNDAEAEVVRFYVDDRSVDVGVGDLAVGYGLAMREGGILTYGELADRGIDTYMSANGRAYASEDAYDAGDYLGDEVQMLIPGERYPEIVAREAITAGGLGLLALGGTVLIVRVRRPV